MMFRDHPDFTITQVPPQRPKNYRRQKIRRARRRAITYNPNRHEEMIWLRAR